MKNKSLFILIIIFITALLFRIWFLNKPEGLWNDEYVSWYIASQKSFDDFLDRALKNCHTPLYYFFLKMWISIFPDTDISLRVSSVLTSLLTVIALFFTGKEYKNFKTGILCALFAALSSFYIYFAQEVRLYSLIALTSTLLVFSCIKLLKTQKKRFLFLFLILNSILCSLHTLGIIFSFFIILYSFYYLYKNFESWKSVITNCKKILQYIFPFLCVLILISPFLYSILFSKTLSQFWSGFSFSKIAFSFIDYFSPIQCNITNSPNTFRTYLFKNDTLDFIFILFALVPSLLAFIALLKAFLKQEKVLNLLIYTCASFFTVLIILSCIGKMILLTKYSSEIYPVLILAFAVGIQSFDKKVLRNTILSLYFILTLTYLCLSPTAAQKLTRPEGNKAPIALIEYSRLKPGDYIIFTYYDLDKFKRYFHNPQDYKIFSINKFNFHTTIFNNENYYEVINKGKKIYKDTFKEFPNKNIINWANTNIIQDMKSGEKVGIVFLEGVSFFTNKNINDIASDNIKYKKTSIVFLTFSMLKNNLLYAFKEGFILDSITQTGDWTLVVYEKI